MNQPSNTLQHGADMADDFLAHYGVLGMKWGKRKGGGTTSKSGTSYKDAYKEALKNKYKNPIMYDRASRKQLRKNPIKHLIGGKAQMVEMNKDVAKQRAAKATYKQGKKATKDAWKKDFGRIVDETQKIQQKAKKGKYTPEIDKKIGDDMAKKFAKAAEAKRNSKVKNKAAYKQSKKLTHGGLIADDFLAHYGVPGMKWGKRKGLSRVSADKKIARLKKANKRTKNSEEFRTAYSRSTAAKSVYGNVISGAKGLHGAGQFAKARKLTEKGSANRKTVNLGAGIYGALGAANVAAGVRTTKRLNSNYYETKAKATTERRVAKRNKKIKNIKSRITHGDILADDFLAHYGGVKSEGGVTHDNNDTLAHYGVLGMKWGKRKGSSGSSVKKAKKNPKASTMSDTELRTKINRLQMEKQYKQLTTKDRSAASKFVGEIVRESAKKTVSSYVSDVMKTGVDAGIGAAKKSKSYDKGRTLAGNAKNMIKKRKGL